MAQTTDIEAIHARAAFHRFDMCSFILSEAETPRRAVLTAPIAPRYERSAQTTCFGEALSRKGTSH